MSQLVIELPDAMKSYVERMVKQGAFATPSEMVQHLLGMAMDSEMHEEIERKLLAGVKESKNGQNIEWTKGQFELMLKEHHERFASGK